MGLVNKLGLFNSSNPQINDSGSSVKTKKVSRPVTSSDATMIVANSTPNTKATTDLSNLQKSPNTSSTLELVSPTGFQTPDIATSLLSASDIKSIDSETKHNGSHTLSHLFHKLAPHNQSPNIHHVSDSVKGSIISSQQKQHELNMLKEHNTKLHQMLATRDKVFGLENFGNTCYMNSIIQCLFVLNEFRDRLMEAHVVKEIHTQKKNYMPLKSRQFTHSSLTNNGQRPKSKSNSVKVVNIDSVLNNMGIKIPGNKVIVGRSSDNKIHSNDTRKKNALLKGPVINVDHLSMNYQNMEKDLAKDDSKRLYYALKDLFEIILESDYNTGVVSPSDFLTTLRATNILFQGGMHQDSQEFLSFLLNSMNEHLESLQKQEDVITTDNNFIKDYFQGCLTNNIKCLKCGTVTKTYDPFFDLQIPVSKKFKNLSAAFNTLIESPPKEVLKGSNKFHCEKCGELQKAERVVEISKLPKFLILHLKRYEYSEKENKMVKLFNKMEYPLLLKNETLKKKYELCGIVVHLGLDSSHGHYVSVIKHEKLGWLIYDDETVMAIQEQDVLKFYGNAENMSCAYLLFYKEMDSSCCSERSNSIGSSGSQTPQSSTLDLSSTSSYSRKGSILSLKRDVPSLKQKEYDAELSQFIEKDDAFRMQAKHHEPSSFNHLESEIYTPPVSPNNSGTKLNFLLSANPLNKNIQTTASVTNKKSETEKEPNQSKKSSSRLSKRRSMFWSKIKD